MFAVAGLPPLSECLAGPLLPPPEPDEPEEPDPLPESPVIVPEDLEKAICIAVGAVISKPRMSAAIIRAGAFSNAFSLNSLPPL